MSLPMLNEQEVEKPDWREDGFLDVHSMFYTVQGEGPFAGWPALFIRLAGCNLQCPACDTDYTSTRELMSPVQIVNRIPLTMSVFSIRPPLVVLTGGEPFRQNIAPLVRELKNRYGFNFPVQIETNGTLALPDFPYIATTLVCSPKTGKIQPGLQPWIRHLKYVLADGHIDPKDGLPTSTLDNGIRPARPWDGFYSQSGVVWVQPADSQDPEQNKQHARAAVASAMTFGYRVSVQIHKILDLP